jgi:glycosyltransferase involved in cell wall biosynthesis/2-polyprenyl-3-methyl-5-hydroxy-6-metoxy-1,4-benzoquinol methylase
MMPKALEWSDGLVERFWDGLAQTGILEKMSFARLAGPTLIEFIEPWIPPGAKCLDYGGGSGHMVEQLVEAGYRTASFEPSRLRAEAARNRLNGAPAFIGVVDSQDTRTFEFVLCNEVIEHIAPEMLDGFVRNLVRKISPEGILLLSTPNAEDLEASGVYCPVCDSTFHRWQHRRSWELPDLKALLERHGLETEWVGLVGFDDIAAVREFHLRRRLGEPWTWNRTEADGSGTPVIGNASQIVYVGRRKERPLSWNEPALLIEAGLREAARLGKRPVAVVPSVSLAPEAPTVIVAPDLLTAFPETVGSNAGDTDVLVFPGELTRMEAAIRDGRLPSTSEGLVFEDGAWHSVLPVRPTWPTTGERRRHPRPGLDTRWWWSRFLRAARLWPWARWMQPYLDRNERVIAATLQQPGDFPFRLSHIFEGRVLLAIGTLGSGGAERQLINTAEGLVQRGFEDVHILVNHLSDDPTTNFYLDKARTFARSVRATPKAPPFVNPWVKQRPDLRAALPDGITSLILSDAQVIRELAPEVVHCSLDWTNITVGLAAVLAGVPHVFLSGRNLSPRYFTFFQWFMYPCYRALARCPGVHLLNNSEAGRLDYARWLRLPAEQIRVIRNGLHAGDFPLVDENTRTDARVQLNLPGRAPVVVGAFRLSSEKRPLLWVDTAARIAREIPDAHFLLCGVGPLESKVRARANSKGLGDRLRLLGARTDIRQIFAAADAVMQTSLQEGTPNVLIEAQACGIPVVTTPAYGAAEAVLDGATGRVVNRATPGALARAVLHFLRNPAARESLRLTGPRFVDERFGFDRMIDDTLSAYAVDGGLKWAAAPLPIEKRYAAYIPLQDIRPEAGLAWTTRLRSLRKEADSAESPQKSRLLLLEDGVILGPAHTQHEVIREQGGGAYSHWGEGLLFSTSDGSDPRTNGRAYAVAVARQRV